MNNPNPSITTRFRKGNPGGPGRTPARTRIARALAAALVKDFDANGIEAIERCRIVDPGTYLELVALFTCDGDGGQED